MYFLLYTFAHIYIFNKTNNSCTNASYRNTNNNANNNITRNVYNHGTNKIVLLKGNTD